MNFQSEYNKIKPEYEDYLQEFQRTISKLLVRYDIPTVFDIAPRLKSIDSILEKHESKRYKIKNSITEFNDLVGIRIVVLFPEYKQKVLSIFENEFDVIDKQMIQNLDVDKFGYNSDHYILKIKKKWLTSIDWENHGNKKIEIQVRSLSEHIWAETSHRLFYKKEENVPSNTKRDLYRLAAILEIVDEKMQGIKDNLEKQSKLIEKEDYKSVLKRDLNSDTFKRIMVHNSKNSYSLNDHENKILSAKFEKDFNILNAEFLDYLIKEEANYLSYTSSEKFVTSLINAFTNREDLQ